MLQLFLDVFRFSPFRMIMTLLLMLCRSVSAGAGLLLILPLLQVIGLSKQTIPQAGTQITALFQTLHLPLTLFSVLLCYTVVLSLVALSVYAEQKISTALQQQHTHHVRHQLISALFKSNWDFISNQQSAHLLHGLTTQVQSVMVSSIQLLTLLNNATLLGVYTFLAFLLSWKMTLLATTTALLLLRTMRALHRLTSQSGAEHLDQNQALLQLLNEHLSALKMIKASGLEQRYIQEAQTMSLSLEQQNQHLTHVTAATKLRYSLGSVLIFSTLLWVALSILHMPFSSLLLLLMIFARILPMVSSSQQIYQRLLYQIPSYRDLKNKLQAAMTHQESSQKHPRSPPTFQDQITLHNISFHRDQPILQKVSFTLKKNTTTALIGPSGIGKSTLADLIVGLLQPTSGHFTMDGHRLTLEDFIAFRPYIAYVTQDTVLFNTSVRNNLQALCPPQTNEALWCALEKAAAADFVRALPQGLDTTIGDNGSQLSTGERQRLALARALLTHPQFLVLDESTSALDQNNITHIQQALKALRGTVTILIISHQTAMSDYADNILSLPIQPPTKHHSLVLSSRQLCDLECLLTDVYAPLTSFLSKVDYDSVCNNLRLSNGALWPIPITLDVSHHLAHNLTLGDTLSLTDTDNTPLASLTITDRWQPDKMLEARLVYGSDDEAHPGVYTLLQETGPWYVSGPLTPINTPTPVDFTTYRHTPAQLKQQFTALGWSKIIAFQTRNPMHRAHYELTKRAADQIGAHLLIHPVVGQTKPGDIDYRTRVRCYEKMMGHYPKNTALLSLLPLAMRMAGPREAVWHALIRKNHGVTHFIVGRDHAGPGLDSHGKPFYEPFAAQILLQRYADEIGITPVFFPAVVYVEEKNTFLTTEELEPHDTPIDLSGSELRRRLETHQHIPAWFSFEEVLAELALAYPPKQTQGYTIFFTGLSGAGKSTIAKSLVAKLRESGHRRVTLLDGDITRRHLSQELGFSKTDRDTHIQRLGYVASEITKHQGIAICAAIAPYDATRQEVRDRIQAIGGFIEIYVSTPIDICRQRDTKGLYHKADLGMIPHFTGVSDPYQVPLDADLILDTSQLSINESVYLILELIEAKGFSWREYSNPSAFDIP